MLNPPSDIQFSKLRFYVVHTLGAKVDKIMHLAVRSCVLPHIKVLICQKMPAHTRCTEATICAHGTQNMHTRWRVHP